MSVTQRCLQYVCVPSIALPRYRTLACSFVLFRFLYQFPQEIGVSDAQYKCDVQRAFQMQVEALMQNAARTAPNGIKVCMFRFRCTLACSRIIQLSARPFWHLQIVLPGEAVERTLHLTIAAFLTDVPEGRRYLSVVGHNRMPNCFLAEVDRIGPRAAAFEDSLGHGVDILTDLHICPVRVCLFMHTFDIIEVLIIRRSSSVMLLVCM